MVGKILIGSKTMKELLEKAPKDQEYVSYKGLHIKRLLLKTCMKYYEIAIKIYLGQELIRRIADNKSENDITRIRKILCYDDSFFSEKWIDAAGMFIPKKDYDLLIEAVKSGSIKSVDLLAEALRSILEKYSDSSWAWCAKLIEERYQTKISEINKDHLIQIINDWQDNSLKLNNMILMDAEKEFDQTSKIGFGIDGDEEIKNKDFENVRGKFEENKFTVELKKESLEITNKSEEMLKYLSKI